MPFLNPHWLAFIPRMCFLPVADRLQFLTQMEPIVIVNWFFIIFHNFLMNYYLNIVFEYNIILIIIVIVTS
jgi:hypothetical protein